MGVPVKRTRGVQVRHLQPAPVTLESGRWPMPDAGGDAVDIPSDALLAGLSPISWAGDAIFFNTPPTTAPFYPAGPAATNKVIMRMILALSARDMHRNGLLMQSPGRPTAEDHGRYHYSLAVKEFRQLLETPRRSVSVAELEMIFATMFLMITYEWQFGHSVRHLQLHLHGVRSLLESHPQLFRVKDANDVFLGVDDDQSSQEDSVTSKVSFIPEQFLLWTLYIDANCGPMGLTESLNDYVLESSNPALKPDHLHRCARLWGRCYWGEQYPDQEVLDDIENYRALELLNIGFTLRHRTWKVLVDSGADADASKSLMCDIMSIRDKYSDLFITARLAGSVSARRTLNTIYMAVCTLYTQILAHRRLLCVDSPPAAIHRQATASIIDICRKQMASDPRLLRRLQWPLFMALIETDQDHQRTWLRQRLSELRGFDSESAWVNEVADQVLAQQVVNQGQYVNLAELLLQRFHVQ
ncbi:transcriptional regulator family: Fungal Specific TF [Penicillium capsulatum]|nr:transcriptional regulator family: Fungal Specific TF [Penicillium capsulatum]